MHVLGIPMDAGKSEGDQTNMVVLSARVVYSSVDASVALAVSEDRAAKWVLAIEHILQTVLGPPEVAQEMADRLLFAVTLRKHNWSRLH